MIIDCISDLHGHFPQLEGGDLLIVAGDLTARDDDAGYAMFAEWFHLQKYEKKIFICGNHDVQLQNVSFPLYIDGYSAYLCDSGTEFDVTKPARNLFDRNDHSFIYKKKLKIWGSPWTKRFEGENPRCLAFTCETEEELAKHWKRIPEDTDILVTHSPVYGVLDVVRREVFCGEKDENVGSESLIKPLVHSNCRLHVCGHIHEAYGKYKNPINGITYVNASHVNERYEPVNKPIRIEL